LAGRQLAQKVGIDLNRDDLADPPIRLERHIVV
jgi:hypothetical protein